MALRKYRPAIEAHDHQEGEALLNDASSSAHQVGTASFLSESMTTRIKTTRSGEKAIVDISGDGSELGLESLTDSRDLDSAHLSAQGHEAELPRSFSALAAIGLGYRYSQTSVQLLGAPI